MTVAYRLPSALHPDTLAADFAVEILSDTPNGRLHKALVETGKAAQVFGYTMATRDPGFVVFGAVVKKGEPLEPVAQTMIEVIEGSLAKQPVTDAEMKRTLQQRDAPPSSARWPIRSRSASACRSTSRSATGGSSSTPGIASPSDGAGRRPGRGALLRARQPRRRLLHPRRQPAACRDSRRRRPRRQLLAEFKPSAQGSPPRPSTRRRTTSTSARASSRSAI